MNIILGISFIIIAALIAIGIIGGPFLIGKPREPLTPARYVLISVVGVLEIIALVIATGLLFGGGQ